MESVTIPFQLLDRLVQEAQAISTTAAATTTATAMEEEKGPSLPEFFQTDLLNLIVNHWRKIVAEHHHSHGHKDPTVLHPQRLMQRLVEYHEVAHSGDASSSTQLPLYPNTQSFAMLMDGAAYFPDGAPTVDPLIDWIIQQALTHAHMQPNVYTFSSLMNAWVKSKHTQAPYKVEEILGLMHELHEEYPDWGVTPNQVTYTTAIDVWAKRGRVDRVQQLLHDMHAAYKQEEEGGHQRQGLKPNLPAFNGLLVALAKAGETDRAQEVLERMETMYEAGELDDPPSVISYSTVLDAFAKSSKHGSARRAEKILRQMKDRGVQPNNISWNIVINAYAKEKNPEQAENLLREMHHEYEQGVHEVKPTTRSYTVVLSAWAAKQSRHSGERGEQLLELMEKLYEAGEMNEPDIFVYNSVLACWASSRMPEAGRKAKEFLEKFIREGKMKPDSYSFNTVMSALIRENRLTDAEQIMAVMRDFGVTPDATAYNTLMNAWVKSGAKDAKYRVEKLYQQMKEDPDAEADVITMNILLHFYSKSNNPEAAEALLNEMCSPESKVTPDAISFNTAISAWTACMRPESPERAEAILSLMLQYSDTVVPNVITFNSLLNSWVKSRPLEAREECRRLVGTMFDLVEQGNSSAQPDVITYNTLINAHSVSGDDDAPLQAEMIFREMDRRYEQGDHRLKPSVHTYGSLINAWSKSKNPQAGQRAEDILRLWMDRADAGAVSERPRVTNFSATVRAYTNSGDARAAHRADAILFLLLREYEKGNEFCKPDNWVFVSVLEALVASTVPNKPLAARRLVDMMKEHQILPDKHKVQLLKQCET